MKDKKCIDPDCVFTQLFTQAEYARKVNKKRCWINQQVKDNNVPGCKVIQIHGTKLIQVNE